MRRRAIGRLFVGATTSASIVPVDGHAQQPPHIGYLSLFPTPPPAGARPEAFRRGLRELGHVEGRSIVVEYRWADFRLDRLPILAEELVARRVAVIVALEPPAAQAAMRATTRIPIVMRSTGDPVGEGLIASLARPGGNVTGLSSVSADLIGKRLELVRELVPGQRRIGVLWTPNVVAAQDQRLEAGRAARALDLDLVLLEVRTPQEIGPAIAAATAAGAAALMVLRGPLIVAERANIARLAIAARLPTMFDDREFVESGALASYGANLVELYRRAATYVDKILRGADPAFLPVEEPTRFELVLNARTAGELGFAIPPSILARADEVIE